MPKNYFFNFKVLTLLLLFIIIWPGTASSQPHIDDFFPEERFSGVTLSPNGEQIALIEHLPNRSEIQVYFSHDLSPVTSINLGVKKARWIEWADNRTLILGIGDPEYVYDDNPDSDGWDEGHKDGLHMVTWYRYRSYIFDVESGDRVTLFTKHASDYTYFSNGHLISTLPDEPDHVLLSGHEENPNLYKINIRTGLAEIIEEGEKSTIAWNVNNNGVPVMRIDEGGGGKYVTILSRPPQTNEWKTVTKVRKTDLNYFKPIAPTSNPEIYYVLARPEGYDKASIFTYNLKDKTFLEQLSTHDKVDIFDAILNSRGEFVGSKYFEDKYEYDFLNKDFNEKIETITQKFDATHSVLIVDVSSDGAFWLLYVAGPTEPGSYYIYDNLKDTTKFIYTDNHYLDPENLGSINIVKHAARDGQKLKGYLTLPANSEGKKLPLVVLPHGGPHTRDYSIFDTFSQFLSSRGYQVFQPNFRGSTGYGYKFEQAGYKQWGGVMQDDITDGVNHLISEGLVDANKICIMGFSYGGYAALMGSVKTPNLFKCAISVNGVSNLQETVKYDLKKFSKDKWLKDFIIESIGHPKKDKQLLQENSPSLRAKEINIPVLIIHGERDDVVPLEQGEEMHEALKELNKSVTFIQMDKADHNLQYITNDPGRKPDNTSLKDSLLHIEDFLFEHLKESSTPP